MWAPQPLDSFRYNLHVKTWDAIVVGGGVIGLCCALELSRRQRRVLIIERGELGREASSAAGGMLAYCDPHTPEQLQPLCNASAGMYPELVLELEEETGVHIDLRREGAIAFFDHGESPPSGQALSPEELARLEPKLVAPLQGHLLPEATVDPRKLVEALSKAVHRRGVDVSSGSAVVEVEMSTRKVTAVRTEKSRYPAPFVINCAGAWASAVAPVPFRTRPVKGQMLAVVPQHHEHFPLRHVVRHGKNYLIPRSDGRIVIGTTVEEAGYDKHVDPATIQSLHQQATFLLPEIGEGRILEAWSGLRPGTPDGRPMIGETSYGGYLAATGHYRDGILLAPITGRIIAALVCGETPEYDLLPFSAERFL